MVRFQAVLKKFRDKGEKTGWIYVEISPEQAHTLNPGIRTSFRVKGLLDTFQIRQLAVIPMGDGSFILPTNAEIRRAIKKQEHATVTLELEVDTSPLPMSEDLIDCLHDEPRALAYFRSLPPGHQNYFSKWIESAKTTETKVKRLTQAVTALAQHMGYGEMIRFYKNKA
ncbi:YdeI/OmpD-associated family protein [Arundinibacter roseus]|uniref:DUF1905 domain-containing protein n=1 Tax=Arundinibacter roseus TaxID=2070510 RepID=A0A4V2XAM8_9BACT|nr:YdeI/OmpD-associated family protein [Arundinibacter roseus]TDB68215.1 DUF1905 domain-containing protein [Arundinibacter roseus]